MPPRTRPTPPALTAGGVADAAAHQPDPATRLAAIAALHQPVRAPRNSPYAELLGDPTLVCAHCNSAHGRLVAWPCATARLVGSWPVDVTG